ncbi:26S protease regulatory subunit 6A, putative [Entamoeba invadens IP1]|uniref:26S protease regulatory subunit 6A, putative n=1 Tax=Entamoeba invadens IP1 TaxID=370355 RepID=A0A0A1UA96_ENTIV|nr:26S protease regulatory subunit 6A, putative [Entamoeba invadens IP1]ELP90091.1 26S protease regulatory subunit 6A, putative [Entamoeba invadens IP1]|eukprot:XP_004256862.1 26S protease regulatory subunit 6A, putative [Entamoeba invadens IP1]
MDSFTEEELVLLNDKDVLSQSTEQIKQKVKQMERQEGVIKHEHERIRQELAVINKQNKESREKIEMFAKLPFLISNVVEILDMPPEETDDGSGLDNKAVSTKGVVIYTSMRSNIFIPVSGLVDVKDIKPGDLVGVNKDTYLILEKLPEQYDGRVKSMEVIERPTETYADVGGLDKQMNEMIEAIVLPMTQKEKFEKLGIQTPKGVLLFGPPGTGKTLMARACAAQTKSTFLKLAAPQLVSSSIGDGSRIIRDMFALAKSKAPAIIFIDEIDAIGTKRNDSEHSGDREIQRTMLELLNQLDGFCKTDDVRVIGATNRIDVLDPALLRSGRFDRKIEFPTPNEEARVNILQIHAKKLKCSDDVNYEELARSTQDFNGAQLKAVCVEAGMFALRREALEIRHEDFQQGILEVQSKKKKSLSYFA